MLRKIAERQSSGSTATSGETGGRKQPTMEPQPDSTLTPNDFVADKLHPLLDYAHFVRETPPDKFKLTRPKLNYIKAQSEAAEEILDAMGARTNAEWFPTRECVAILKNFSTSTYELLHLHVSAPYYSLGDTLEKFKQDTAEHIRFMTEVIRLSLINLNENAERLGINIDQTSVNYVFKEILVVPKLKRNMTSTEPGSVKHRIDAMAINVLNSTEDMKNFKKLFEASVSDWDKLDFDFLNETKIRSLEVNMHTLQSMYDTYISDSETEDMDDDLRKVRGRISVILHLLRIASIYIHFYERHIHGNPMAVLADKESKRDCTRPVACVNQEAFYTAILKYLAYYIETFQNEGRQLCSLLLQRYCVTKTVEAKVPPYVGFHVRPSSLVAAIVKHYGCDVHMRLWDTEYDAGNPLNIMMSNNYLDQKKRAFLVSEMGKVDFSDLELQLSEGFIDKLNAGKQAILKLASAGLVRIYKLPLEIERDKFHPSQEASFADYVFQLVVYLMNYERQVGILFPANVQFTGPEQAVDDLLVLANANYCESETGEDLPLPKQLEYLSFKRKTLTRKREQES